MAVRIYIIIYNNPMSQKNYTYIVDHLIRQPQNIFLDNNLKGFNFSEFVVVL